MPAGFDVCVCTSGRDWLVFLFYTSICCRELCILIRTYDDGSDDMRANFDCFFGLAINYGGFVEEKRNLFVINMRSGKCIWW